VTYEELGKLLEKALLARPDFIARFGEDSPGVAAKLAMGALQYLHTLEELQTATSDLPEPPGNGELASWLQAAVIEAAKQMGAVTSEMLAEADNMLADARRELRE